MIFQRPPFRPPTSPADAAPCDAAAAPQVLIVYYSLSGVTAVVAKRLAEHLQADVLALGPQGEPARGLTGRLAAWWQQLRGAADSAAAAPPTAPDRRYRLVLIGAPIWLLRPAAPLWSALRALDLRGAAVAGFFTMTHAYNPYSAARLAAQVQAGGGRYLSHFTVQYRGAPERAGHDAALHLQIDSLLTAHLPAWQQQARLDPAGLRQPDSAPRPRPSAVEQVRRSTVLVGLQPRGTRPPLFCVTSGYGDVLALATLAQQVGQDQPFYVLQPPTDLKVVPLVGDAAHTQHRLDLVRAYVEAIRQVAPRGPYRIAGYSAGGLMASAVAEYLSGSGAAVEHLILLDPAGSVPRWEYRLFTSLKAWVNRRIPRIDPRRSRVWHLYHAYFTDDGFMLHVGAVTGYVPYRCAARTTFINATGSLMRFTLRLPRWRWAVGEQLALREVPGDHLTFFRAPHVATLALCLRELLREPPAPAAAP